MSKEKRKPNWTLCVKDGEKWRDIGVAWESERGNLFLKLNEGEQLEGTAMLFPYRERTDRSERRPPPVSKPISEGDYMERKRQERRQERPLPPPTAHCSDPVEPEWL